MAPTATGHQRQHSRRRTRAAKPSRSPPLTPSATMPTAASCPSPSVVAATATGSQPLHPGGTVSSKMRGAGTIILSLDKSLVEVPNPCGGPPVELQPKVVSTDGDQVLVELRSSHGAIPSAYFACSGPGGDPVFLAPLPAVVFLAESMALLDCRNGSYLVAHLSITHNQKPGGFITEGSLNWCKYNNALSSLSSAKTEPWIHDSVTLPLPNLRNWHNHRVIPFNGTDLMWIDLKQGILRMSLNDGKPSSFQFVALPNQLSSISTKYWRGDRPEMYRSIGCCNGKVQFVNLHIPDGSSVAVDIWTLDLENGNWSKDYNKVSFVCRNLWASYYINFRDATAWPYSVPISPFLREANNSTILCLTVVDQKNKNKKKAWLLQIDMQTITLKHVTKYPRYYSHMKQPFLINSSSIMPKGTLILSPL